METDKLRKDTKGLAVSQEVQVQFSFPCLDRDFLEFAEIRNVETSFIPGCYGMDYRTVTDDDVGNIETCL